MSTTNKLLLAVTILMMVALVVLYAVKTAALGRRAAEIARLEATLSECGRRVKDADAAIERQNAAVESVRVDTVYVEQLIKQAETKYVEIREVVTQSLERDGSCENKIDNIDAVMRRFHGVGVLPEGDGKN